MPAASCRIPAVIPRGQIPAGIRKQECGCDVRMCSIPPVLFLIIEFRAASSRRISSRDRFGLAFTAKCSLVSCYRREKIATKVCQKQGARSRRAALEVSTMKKASSARRTVRTKQDASVEGGRNASATDFKQEVRRSCAVIQRPGLRELTALAYADWISGGVAAIVPGPDPSGSLAVVEPASGRGAANVSGLA